jgi:hypothetical protein
MINLDEHKIFNHDLKLETVPLSVAKAAVAEALESVSANTVTELESVMSLIQKSMLEMNEAVEELSKLENLDD